MTSVDKSRSISPATSNVPSSALLQQHQNHSSTGSATPLLLLLAVFQKSLQSFGLALTELHLSCICFAGASQQLKHLTGPVRPRESEIVVTTLIRLPISNSTCRHAFASENNEEKDSVMLSLSSLFFRQNVAGKHAQAGQDGKRRSEHCNRSEMAASKREDSSSRRVT